MNDYARSLGGRAVWRGRLDERLTTAGAAVVAAAAGAAIPFVSGRLGALPVAVMILAAGYIGCLWVIPVAALAPVALATTLLVPTQSSLLPGHLQNVPVGVLPLGVWLVRTPATPSNTPGLQRLAIAVTGWLLLSEIFAPFHSIRGLEWLVAAWICVVGPLLRAPADLSGGRLRRLFLLITTPVACYALVEAFILKDNVLFAVLYRNTSWWAGQHAGASYRATTLFGHPLVNGTIFAAAAVLAAAELVERTDRLWLSCIRFVILVGAVLSTHSRGPALALAAGIAFVIAASPGKLKVTGLRRMVLAGSAVAAGLVIVLGLQARDASFAGQANVAQRTSVVKYARQAASRVEPFGAGPGQSEQFRVQQHLPGTSTPLENSYAETLVSLGPLGALLFCLALCVPIYRSLRMSVMVGEAGALATILVAIGGFNAIEEFTPVMVMIGLFAISLLYETNRHRSGPERTT